MAIRLAILHGYTNGIAKALMMRIVDLVVDHGVCSEHELKLNL